MAETLFAPGQIIKLTDPPAGEEGGVYRVLELRGARVLVQDISPYWDDKMVRPTFVFDVTETELA